MTDNPAGVLQLIRMFADDRWLAHRHLFKHRHPEASPDAHRELVLSIHSPDSRLSIEGFRGFAKSTYLEEAAILRACNREFHNMVIVGSSYTRACDRLAAVKREFEINDAIHEVYGLDRPSSPIWQEGKIVLATGVCIQALGREQSTVGMKHLDWRPDAALIDDVEDPNELRTDAERAETWDWFIKTFLPSLAHFNDSWVRVLGTRRGIGSLPERLENKGRRWGRYSGWPTVKFPVEFINEDGERQAIWPSKYPLPEIDRMKETYSGDMHTWMQEFMCEAVSESDRTFGHIPVSSPARVRTFEATYAMYDPARTVGPKSAVTGKVVWSWIRSRLVFWESSGELWLPDELIADVFEVNDRFSPIWIGVEEDGLNEWIRQPLRHEQVRRGVMLPLKPVKAPRGKIDFIKALQPYANAGEIEFAVPMPDFQDQLLSFPHGKIDIPNAAAYALSMRPGAPIYDGFRLEHVADELPLERPALAWLAANATRGLVTAALLQYVMGRVRILADWAIEAEPMEAVPLLLREVGMRYRITPTAVMGPTHQDKWLNVGLAQAFRAVPMAAESGAEPAAGRAFLRDAMGRTVREMPMLQVASGARLTLNAMAGGYARSLDRRGQLGEEAEQGLYRVLMEGIESCVGRMAANEEIDENANWSYTPDGRRYQRYGSVSRRTA